MDALIFIIGAGWLALLIVGVIAFGTWFDVWVHIKYRLWEQVEQDNDESTLPYVFYVLPGHETDVLTKASVLETYTTETECQSERTRIDKAMHESYPNDEHGWVLECKVAESKL